MSETGRQLLEKALLAQANMSPSKTTKRPPRGNILFVSNISPKLNYQQIKQGLYQLFSPHGPIFQILIKTKQNGNHFAFVDYPDVKDAQKALSISRTEGKILQGKQLLVNYCEDPRKNHDRKDQKCFICHSLGHKARNCTVRPDLIKPKPKQQVLEEQSDNQSQMTFSDLSSVSSVDSSFRDDLEEICKQKPSGKRVIQQRDQDYLRFLRMKKRMIEQRIYEKLKKVYEPKQQKNSKK